jgi:membrane-bound serine protease (ClpP class)
MANGKTEEAAAKSVSAFRFPTRLPVSRLTIAVAVTLGLVSAAAGQDRVPTEDDGRPRVVVARVENKTISPVTSRFIEQTLRQAEDEQAECLIILLDTPGGLLNSTREIVKQILASRICVVVYVAPTGAQAASAGGFITLASHVAAMAPTTTIGAMHPVSIGSLPVGPQTPGDDATAPDDRPASESAGRRTSSYEEKVVNNTAAWARGLAARRGRNAEWAEQAVNESVVATDREALEAGIVELVAVDVDDLLRQLDGRSVEVQDRDIVLRTAEAEVDVIDMWWGAQVLATIADPNVAFLLLIIGFYGVLFEFYSPGWGVAGTLGAVCLVLAAFGMSVLPVNYSGLLLIAVALGMFVAEVFVTSYGALAAGGVICLAMGALMLVDSPAGFMRVSLSVVVPVSAATAAITILLVGSVVRAHRRRAATGSEAMLGSEAHATARFANDHGLFRGTVQLHGEYWNAVSAEQIESGDTVQVDRREGLTLHVTPRRPSASPGREG